MDRTGFALSAHTKLVESRWSRVANRELRDSKYECPKCGKILKERWVFGKTEAAAGPDEWQKLGRAYCPSGHQLEWTGGGPA